MSRWLPLYCHMWHLIKRHIYEHIMICASWWSVHIGIHRFVLVNAFIMVSNFTLKGTYSLSIRPKKKKKKKRTKELNFCIVKFIKMEMPSVNPYLYAWRGSISINARLIQTQRLKIFWWLSIEYYWDVFFGSFEGFSTKLMWTFTTSQAFTAVGFA